MVEFVQRADETWDEMPHAHTQVEWITHESSREMIPQSKSLENER